MKKVFNLLVIMFVSLGIVRSSLTDVSALSESKFEELIVASDEIVSVIFTPAAEEYSVSLEENYIAPRCATCVITEQKYLYSKNATSYPNKIVPGQSYYVSYSTGGTINIQEGGVSADISFTVGGKYLSASVNLGYVTSSVASYSINVPANVSVKALLKRVDIVVDYYDVWETYPNQGIKKYIGTKQYIKIKTKYYGLITPAGKIY